MYCFVVIMIVFHCRHSLHVLVVFCSKPPFPFRMHRCETYICYTLFFSKCGHWSCCGWIDIYKLRNIFHQNFRLNVLCFIDDRDLRNIVNLSWHYHYCSPIHVFWFNVAIATTEPCYRGYWSQYNMNYTCIRKIFW